MSENWICKKSEMAEKMAYKRRFGPDFKVESHGKCVLSSKRGLLGRFSHIRNSLRAPIFSEVRRVLSLCPEVLPVKKGFDKKDNRIFLVVVFAHILLDKKAIHLAFQSLLVPCVLLSTAVTPSIIEEVSSEWLEADRRIKGNVIGKKFPDP